MDDNLKKLYDVLGENGYEIPDFDRFKIGLSDDDNLRTLHTTLQDDGWDIPVDFDTFRGGLGLKKKDEFGLSESPSPKKESGSKSFLEFFKGSIPETHAASSLDVRTPDPGEIPDLLEGDKEYPVQIPTLQDIVTQAKTPALYDALDPHRDQVTARPSQIIERQIETLSKSSPEVERRKQLIEERDQLLAKGSAPDPQMIMSYFAGDRAGPGERKRLSALNKEIGDLNNAISDQEDRIRAEWRDAYKEREDLFFETRDIESDVVLKIDKLTDKADALTNDRLNLEAKRKAGTASQDDIDKYNARLEEFQKDVSGYEGSLREMADKLERVAFLDKKITAIDDDIRANYTNEAKEVGNSLVLGLLSSVEGFGGWLQKSGVGKEADLTAFGRKIIGERMVEWSERVSEPYRQYIEPTQKALGDFDWNHLGDARFWTTNAPMMIGSSLPYMVTGHIGGIAGKLIAPRLIAGSQWGQLGSRGAKWAKFLTPGIIGSATSTPLMAMSYGGQTYLQALENMKAEAETEEATPEMEAKAAKAANRTFYEVFAQGMITNTLQHGLMYDRLPFNRFLGSRNKFVVGTGRNAIIIGEQGAEEWFQEYRTYRNAEHFAGKDYLSFGDWRRTPEGKMIFVGGAVGGMFHAGFSGMARTVVDNFTGLDVNRKRYIQMLKHVGTADFAMTGDDMSSHHQIDRLIEMGELHESDRDLVMKDIETLRNDPVFQRMGRTGYMSIEMSDLVSRQSETDNENVRAEIEAEKVKIADTADAAGISIVQQGNSLVAYKDGNMLPVSDMNPEQKAYYDLTTEYFNKRQQALADAEPIYKVGDREFDNINDFREAVQAIQSKEEMMEIHVPVLGDPKAIAEAAKIYTDKRTELGMDTETFVESEIAQIAPEIALEIAPEITPEKRVETDKTELKPEPVQEREVKAKPEPKIEPKPEVKPKVKPEAKPKAPPIDEGKITFGMGAMLSELVSKIDGVIRTEKEIAQEDLYLLIKENEADIRRALSNQDVAKLLKRVSEPKGQAAIRKIAEDLKSMIEESSRIVQTIPRAQSLIQEMKALTRGEPNIEGIREGLTEFIKNNRADLNNLLTTKLVTDLLARAEGINTLPDADRVIATLEDAIGEAEMVYHIAEEGRSAIRNIKDAIEAGRKLGLKAGTVRERAKVRELRKQLQDFIDENKASLMRARGRSVMALMRRVNQADTLGKLDAAVKYMENLMENMAFAREETAKENMRDRIMKMLSDDKFIKVESDRLKKKGVELDAYELLVQFRDIMEAGNDTSEVQARAQAMLDRIEASRKVMPEVGGEINYRDYTDQEISAIELLSVFNAVNDRQTLQDLTNIRDALKAFIDNEKSKFRQNQEKLREENRRLKEETWTILSGTRARPFSESYAGREIRKIRRDAEASERDLTQEEQDRIDFLSESARPPTPPRRGGFVREAAQTLGNLKTAHWWGVLDMLSRNLQNMGDIFKTRLHELFGDPVRKSEETYSKLFTEVVKDIQDAMMDIFQFTSKNDRITYMENSKQEHEITYKFEGKEKKAKISQQQAAYLYMKFQDPNLQETNDKHYPQEKRDVITKFLDPKMRAWADYQLEVLYPKLYEKFNPYHREYFGRDMPFRDMYSPVFRAIDGDDMFDAFEKRSIHATVNHRSTKMMSRSNEDYRWMEADMVLSDYAEKMAYWAAWHPTIGKLNLIFKSRDTSGLIAAEFGQQYNEVIHDFIDDFARIKKGTGFIKIMDNLRTRVYPATLGLKPTISIKQLTSIPAFASFLPMGQLTRGMASFWANPRKNWNTLMESEFMKERYRRGWTRDLLLDMKKSYEKMVTNKSDFLRDWSMIAVKYGDRAAIVLGGWAVYDYHYRQNKHLGHQEAHKIALSQFEYASRLSQQASHTADLSYWQRHSSFAKLMTMYQNAPLLYNRTMAAAGRRLIRGQQPLKMARIIFINHVLLPSLFQFVGNGFDWHDKDQIQAAVLGNLNTLFLLGKLGEHAFEAIIGNQKGAIFGGPEFTSYTSHIAQGERALREFVKLMDQASKGIHPIGLPEILDVADKSMNAIAPFAGVPYPALSNAGRALIDVVTESYETPKEMTLKFLGWSDWAVQRGDKVSVLWDKHERVMSQLPENVSRHYDLIDVDEYLFILEMEKLHEDETYQKIRKILNDAEGRVMSPEEQDELERLQDNFNPWKSGERAKEAKQYMAYRHYDIMDKKVREDLEVLLGGGNNESKADYMRLIWKRRFKSDDTAFQMFFIDVYRDELGSYPNEEGGRTDASPVITDQLLKKYEELWGHK